MCGKTLISPETAKGGFTCKCVYVIEELEIAKEIYVSIENDRLRGYPVIHLSDKGGVPFIE